MGNEEKITPTVTKSIKLGEKRISVTDGTLSIGVGFTGTSIRLEELGDALRILGVEPKEVFKDLKDMMIFDLPVPTFEQTVAMSDHRDRIQQAMEREMSDSSPSIKAEMQQDGVLVVDFPKNAGWCRSEFPHPLLTLDFDETNRLCRIMAVGELARALRDS